MGKIVVKTVILLVLGYAIIFAGISAKENTGALWYRDQVAVLMYHHVHDVDQSLATIPTELFSSHLDYLIGKGYNFISSQQFKQFLEGGSIPDNAVLVTVDDGYESFFDHVYPLLKEKNIPAINFVITEFLDNPSGGNIPYLSHRQVEDIASAAADIDFQCHSHALHRKSESGEALMIARIIGKDGVQETESEYKERIKKDTRTCIDSLNQSYPQTIDSLAYPYGIYDELAIQLIKEEGIRYAFTVEEGMVTQQTDPWQIPRINAGGPWITAESLHQNILNHVVAATK